MNANREQLGQPTPGGQDPTALPITMVDGTAQPALPEVDDAPVLPEARLARALSDMPENEQPDLVNPKNPKMPSAVGRVLLECLQNLGTADTPNARKDAILELTLPIVKHKPSRKTLTRLIGGIVESEPRELAASGFSITKNELSKPFMPDEESAVEKTKQTRPTSNVEISVTDILKDNKATQSERARALTRLFSARNMSSPEDFFDEEFFESIKYVKDRDALTPQEAQSRAAAQVLNTYESHDPADVANINNEWREYFLANVEEHPEIAQFALNQLTFLRQLYILTAPDLRHAAGYVDTLINDSRNLTSAVYRDDVSLKEKNLSLDKAASSLLAVTSLPVGASRSVRERHQRRIVGATTRILIAGKENTPRSLAKRAIDDYDAADEYVRAITAESSN